MLPRSGFVLFTFIVCLFDARLDHTKPSQRSMPYLVVMFKRTFVSHDCIQNAGTIQKLSSSIACYLIVFTKIQRPLSPPPQAPRSIRNDGQE